MNLGTTTSNTLLDDLRDIRVLATNAAIRELACIAHYAELHTVTDETMASTLTERGLDTGLPVAGPGAPLVSDFAVMDLATVLGRSLDSGRNYVGQVVELCWRLPQTWERVLAGAVPVYKALRIADHTRLLPWEAAAYVDAHLAPFAHSCSWAQIERLVDEALIRYDPDAAAQKARDDAETRHVDLGINHVGPTGIAHGTTALNLPDALDLENAVQRRAKLLGQLGDDDTLDVRRAKALGEIAREDLALDLDVVDPDTGEITRTIPARKTVLTFHLSEDGVVARCGNTRTPLTVETIKHWMSTAPGTVIVRPVQDLADCQPVDSYEIPDRLRHQVELARHHCGYPYCTRPAEACDLDHAIPYGEGGPTCACNLCPECRGHHRFKTSGQATVRILRPGVYYWTTPSGTYLVDPTGTYPLTSRPGTDQLEPE
ncbi:DUF222 domain-containing protein [Nocardioides humilatus]|uniref:DUF222 domain-containing protein n=1 Tax=Nocardioides humilatus TaxID=2607660 RepID=A0A5B1LEF2_9ACTN|nr:HNH endonuclease signature motif containing protein [Nocardioides humilatus]KAA1418694.1 DUF222 domain-containing protein [Nocardioides humilatus]